MQLARLVDSGVPNVVGMRGSRVGLGPCLPMIFKARARVGGRGGTRVGGTFSAMRPLET